MNDKKYSCQTCPYPRYRGEGLIFCDVCIRELMERHRPEMPAALSAEKLQDKEGENES